MLKIRLEKGVTMLVLVITIIVLLILAGVSINFAIKDSDFAIEKKQLSELEMVGHAVYQQYIKYKETGTEEFLIRDTEYTDLAEITIDSDMLGEEINPEVKIKQSEADESIENKWYKLDKTALKKIGIQNSSYEYIVKYSTGEVYNITSKTSKQNGKTLYLKISE